MKFLQSIEDIIAKDRIIDEIVRRNLGLFSLQTKINKNLSLKWFSPIKWIEKKSVIKITENNSGWN